MRASHLVAPSTSAGPTSLKRVLWLIVALTTVFLLVWRWPFHNPLSGAANYLPLHMALESAAIVVSMLVFGVAWNAYHRERPGNVIIIACALLAAAIVGFVHMLSFAGMPEFVTPSGPEKAINFWLAARFVVAIGFLAAALRPWTPLVRPWARYALLGGSLAFSTVVIWIGLYHQDQLPHTFVVGQGLTTLKIAAEYGIVAILVVPAAIFLRRSRQRVPYDATNLFAAVAVSILSELCFTLYVDVTDIFNLLGHVYLVVAYLFIYRAVFVTSVREPFVRVVAAEATLREREERFRLVFENASDAMLLLEVTEDGRFPTLEVNPAFVASTGLTREQAVGHTPEETVPEAVAQQVNAGCRGCAETGMIVEKDQQFDLPAGRRSFHTTLIPVRNDAGRVDRIVGILRDMTEREWTQRELVRLGQVVEQAVDGVLVLDATHRVVLANPSMCAMLGYGHDEIIGLDILETYLPEDRPQGSERLDRLRSGAGTERFERAMRRKDGSAFPVEVLVSALSDGDVQAVVRDVSERRRAEEALHRLNRELRAISNCNQILMRAEDEQSLLNDICRIVCDEAGYRMAWVGYAQNDDPKSVRPVAWAGVEDGYLAAAGIRWADTERGRGSTGTAIRTGESRCIQDFATEPQAAPWRENALQRGYRSSIALPLKDAGAHTFGALTIYSTEPNAFTADEIRLLEELSRDLAFGITVLRTRVARNQVEDALRESERRYREVFDNVTDSIFVFDVTDDGRFRFASVNDTATGFSGVSDSAASGKSIEEVLRPEVVDSSLPYYRRCVETGEVIRYEEEYPRPAGGRSYLSKTLVPVRATNGAVCRLIEVTTDITARKRAEEERLARLRFVESMDQVNRAILEAHDLDQMMSGVLDVALAALDCDRAWLFHPCDPNAPLFRVPMEVTKPEYPGAGMLNVDIPLPSDMAENLREALDSALPVTYAVGTDKPINKVSADQFGVQSMMLTALHPKSGKPWAFGVHQCSYPRVWTSEEKGLLQEIGRRLTDALSSLLANRELQESEAKYRRIVDTATEGIWGIGADTLTTFVNARMAEMLGYSCNDMIGRPVTDFMFEEDVPDHLARMENRRQGMSEVYERRFRRQDGETIWVQASTVPVFDDGHRFAGAMAMFTAITERKRAERRLQREIDGGHILLDLYDRAQLLVDKELFDYTLDQAVRLTNSSIGFFHRVSDDQKSVILTTWNAEALKGCTADYDAVYPLGEAGNWVDCVRFKKPIVYNDYETSPNKRGLPPGHSPILRFMSVPVLEGDEVRFIFGVGNKTEPYEDGDVVQLQLVASELQKILARRRGDEALRASEERYRRFVEDDVAGAFVSTPDGRLLACNPAFARMIGFASVEEALGTNVVDLYQDRAARDPVLAELRVQGRVDQREIAWRRLDGSPLGVVETAIGDFDEAGELVAIRGYLIDVTERKRLEEQLRQSQKMEAIGRLAGGVAHDFNNLLTAINGYADMLVAGMAPDDQRRPDVEEIRKAGDRAVTLTRQLLAFSRRQVLQPVVIDLNDVVAGIVPMLRRLVGEQIELRTLPTPDPANVRADPSQIEQVLLNLVVNARDAMPTGGTLTIETAHVELDDEYAQTHTLVAPGPYVQLAVNDTGIGMDEATMAHLFEPFFTTKALGEGTGLGLATVYGIVAQSGGVIAAYSEPGHGSVFKVSLPRVAEAIEPRALAVPVPAASGAETILLVEDEDAVRAYVARVLGKLGYTVSTARSGPDALEFVADHRGPIDLLVTDVMLPGMNGRELSEQLSALRPSLRTLFISGYTEDSIVHRGELDPGVAFLSKPFTPDALGHAVRDVLAADKVIGGGPAR